MQLSEKIPREHRRTESVHAKEGTAAHELAEACLTQTRHTRTYIGDQMNGVLVTREMADHVQEYVDLCNELASRATRVWIEARLTLEKLKPQVPMYGTGDFAAYFAETRRLVIADLKFGAGVVVEVIDNPQLLYYALGAALTFDLEVDEVEVIIVQPRAEHDDGPVRRVVFSGMDLLNFGGELMAAARETQKPNAPLNPGKHCRWCPASGVCPAQYSQAQAIAQFEFDTLPADVPPVPALLPDALFAEMLPKLDILDDWIAAMRKHAFEKLMRGEDVPGYKLVAKRAQRRWVDEEKAAEWLIASKREAPADLYEPRKLRSVAQIEKLIGKKNLPDKLHKKESYGANLAPITDRRPALIASAAEDFALLEAGSSTG